MARRMGPNLLRSRLVINLGSRARSHCRRLSRTLLSHPSFHSSLVGSRLRLLQSYIQTSNRFPDIIPTPNLGAGPSSSRLADLVPRHDFDNLNRDAANPSNTSRRLEQSLEHVQNLLNPSRIAQL